MFAVGIPPVIVSVGILGIDLDRLSIVGDRLAVVFLIVIGIPPVIVGVGEARVKLD